jgi:spermidine synthase
MTDMGRYDTRLFYVRNTKMTLDNTWFSEIYPQAGSAFSLKIESLLHEEQSAYQHIAVYQTEEFGRLMVIDGCIMLSDRDNFIYHEMMSHPVLYSHADPQDVVIIGGGDCGTLREVLMHQRVKQATLIDIDERVTRLSEQYFPDLCESNGDPRAELLFADGIQWMQERAAASVDIIIIDSTDPVGPAEGLFRKPFYESCLRALKPGGLLIQQSESPLLHADSIIREMHETLLDSGFGGVSTLIFPQTVYPSGWWSGTMAGRDGKPEFLREAEAREERLDTRYYSPDMHRAALVLPPFLEQALPKP